MVGKTLSRWERILYTAILVLAIFTRFYMLGERAISHDESIHTKFAWNFYAGLGFQHNPMMHGPLLFEATALVYRFFGVSDFSSRIFTSLAGVALVMTPILFRRWLSRPGALAVSLLLLISPSISYYSRYIRHDVLLMLTAVLLLWAILEFLETGQRKLLLWLAAFFSLMYATKEASYIYTAIFGALLFVPFAVQVVTTKWQNANLYWVFAALLMLALVAGLVFGLSLSSAQVSEMNLDEAGNSRVANISVPVWGRLAVAVALAALLGALAVVTYGLGDVAMRQIRLFDVLMVIGTLTLPLGSAFLVKFAAGVDMELVYEAVRTGNFASVPTETVIAIFGVVFATLAISAAMGMWWDSKLWPKVALVHYAIFFVLYSSIFTWAFGVLSGLVGGLAYWLAQQGVKRGNQPMYYYFLIGPLYEYLGIALSLAGASTAMAVVLKSWRERRRPTAPDELGRVPALDLQVLFPLLLVGWTGLSWIAYTYAGEKMPWLLVHITLPSLFLGGWALGKLVVGIPWSRIGTRPGWAMLAAVPLSVASLVAFSSAGVQLRSVMEQGGGGAGFSLGQLWALGMALGGLAALVGFGSVVVWAVRQLGGRSLAGIVALWAVVGFATLTMRTSALLNYVNYDLATEILVYAHGTPDIKLALNQIREVSWRVTGTEMDVKVAYSEDGSWPFTWYMVDFPNNYFYSTAPNESQLLECPVVIAGSRQYGAVESILGDGYVFYDYRYLWWPIQDYYGLTWERVRNALTNPEMRAALWKIVWDREYDDYAALKNPANPFTLQSWPYRSDFRLYVRRDLAEAVTVYGRPSGSARLVAPAPTPPPDPYGAGARLLPEVTRVLLPGAAVRGIAALGDGQFYVADTANHRIWHVGPEGVIGSFGGFGAEPGQFNEPWGVAVDAQGDIYVADTWNHRIQKFDNTFTYVTGWGGLAQSSQIGLTGTQGLFYGPRALDVSDDGEVYVADTGNKRVQVFDLDGNFLREFGGWGREGGELDEPVGIDVRSDGVVALADTWNQRVQLFDGRGFPLTQWDIPTWDVTNPDEKPFVVWGAEHLYVGDPLRQRILAFREDGAYVWALSSDSAAPVSFPQGLSVDGGVLYVADAHRGEVLGFQLP